MEHRPRIYSDGENIFYLRKKLVLDNSEIAVILSLICNRRLFGRSYCGLMPDCFENMGKKGGVLIGICVPTGLIIPGITFPGDIDLLVIPYEKDRLIVSKTLCIEVKVVRATYSKQSKAPNEFGFSQANATLAHGFPYSAVAHIIAGNSSPQESWREVFLVEIKNPDTGELGKFSKIRTDMLPRTLMDRTSGRLNAHCNNAAIGLLSAYVSYGSDGFWLPWAKPATKNPKLSMTTCKNIGDYYKKYYRYFVDIPKYAS